jgi:hypothetical protein
MLPCVSAVCDTRALSATGPERPLTASVVAFVTAVTRARSVPPVPTIVISPGVMPDVLSTTIDVAPVV